MTSPLKATDFQWASGDAYASKVVEYQGKFYWFVSVTHEGGPYKAIGVAVSDNPTGPFVDEKGAALVTHDMLPVTQNDKANLDPTVLIDDDGKAYLFWGNGQCYFAKLKANLTELDSDIRTLNLPRFAEGAHIHKKNGIYYLAYGYGYPEKVAYATSRSIEGPWEFKGADYFFYHNGALPEGGSHRRSVCLDRLYYEHDGSIRRVIMTTEGVLR